MILGVVYIALAGYGFGELIIVHLCIIIDWIDSQIWMINHSHTAHGFSHRNLDAKTLTGSIIQK